MNDGNTALNGVELDAAPMTSGAKSLVSDLMALARLRIVAMVLLTMLVAAWASSPGPFLWGQALYAAVGVGMVVVGAIVFNQRMEWLSDARMERTANRPIPSGRISPHAATAMGATITVLGVAMLAWSANPALTGLAVLSWFIYVGMYTPLKPVSVWQTAVGALAGAMPALLGTAVVGGWESPHGWVLFGVIYLWQFPHAMAIAELYREQYAKANVRVAPVVDDSGRLVTWLTLFGATALLGLSAAAARWGEFSTPGGWALILGAVGYLVGSLWFVFRRNAFTARWLLRGSLLYLPLACAAFLLG
ncbi:MAG: protoheme IX farnesyltransferase [Planctomycetota bacterium]|nr:MAG: protoheme IX farnesyltransferase [Planctomycetota bacterium]